MVKITDEITLKIGRWLRIDWNKVNFKEFKVGLRVEQEHRNITKGSLITTGKIALAHLKEMPDYYIRLRKMERRR